MRRATYCRAALGAAALAGILVAAGLLWNRPGTAAESPPPATDEKWTVKPYAVPSGAEPEPADNSYCYVCHANYEEEELTDVHQAVGVGCETCHGMSMKHSEDENNITPPDIMWPAHRINGRCMTCHARDALLSAAQAVNHREFFERLDRPAEKAAGEKYCTECHAQEHKLAHRTRVWNRETGELTKQTGGPAMDR